MNIKKVTVFCWFIAGLSLITYLVNVVIMINVDNWNSDVSTAIRIIDYVARTSLAISLAIGILLRYRSKNVKQMINKRIEKFKSIR